MVVPITKTHILNEREAYLLYIYIKNYVLPQVEVGETYVTVCDVDEVRHMVTKRRFYQLTGILFTQGEN